MITVITVTNITIYMFFLNVWGVHMINQCTTISCGCFNMLNEVMWRKHRFHIAYSNIFIKITQNTHGTSFKFLLIYAKLLFTTVIHCFQLVLLHVIDEGFVIINIVQD